MTTLIPTALVGSLPKPGWLAEEETLWSPWKLEGERLREGKLDALALAVADGVVKMNIDTDTQYAFTRSVAGFMFQNYDGVLKVDGEVGNKKAYDPRAWGKAAEEGMAKRVVEACEHLGSAGKSQGAKKA